MRLLEINWIYATRPIFADSITSLYLLACSQGNWGRSRNPRGDARLSRSCSQTKSREGKARLRLFWWSWFNCSEGGQRLDVLSLEFQAWGGLHVLLCLLHIRAYCWKTQKRSSCPDMARAISFTREGVIHLRRNGWWNRQPLDGVSKGFNFICLHAMMTQAIRLSSVLTDRNADLRRVKSDRMQTFWFFQWANLFFIRATSFSEFTFYASGRRNCFYALFKLDMYKRHCVFSNWIVDKMYSPGDVLTVDIPIRFTGEVNQTSPVPIEFFICHKSKLRSN